MIFSTRALAVWALALLAFGTLAVAETPLACLGNDENWVFCSGFEEGNFDLWDDYDGNPAETNLLVSDPGPFGREGNHVARLRAREGSGGADLVKVLPASYDRIYARWYMKWEPGYDFDARNHGGGLHAGDRSLLGGTSGFQPDGTDKFSATLENYPEAHRLTYYSYNPAMHQDCVDPEGSCWGDAFPCLNDNGEVFCTIADHRPPPLPPVLESGRWYNIEMHMDGGTPTASAVGASGILNLWIDGVEYGPWTNLWYRSTPDLKLTILWLNLWFHGEHSVEGIMLDEVVVSTQRIGAVSVPVDEDNWGSLKSRFR